MHADHVIDMGVGAGVHGGEIVAQGTPADIMSSSRSLTGQYLSGKKKIAVPTQRVQNTCRQQLRLKGAKCHNLKNVDV